MFLNLPVCFLKKHKMSPRWGFVRYGHLFFYKDIAHYGAEIIIIYVHIIYREKRNFHQLHRSEIFVNTPNPGDKSPSGATSCILLISNA